MLNIIDNQREHWRQSFFSEERKKVKGIKTSWYFSHNDEISFLYIIAYLCSLVSLVTAKTRIIGQMIVSVGKHSIIYFELSFLSLFYKDDGRHNPKEKKKRFLYLKDCLLNQSLVFPTVIFSRLLLLCLFKTIQS